MILALRQRHRRMMAVIGILVPIAFAVGIAARKPVPHVAALPVELAPGADQDSTVSQRTDLFAKIAVQVLQLRLTGGNAAIRLSAPKDFARPDLLVYWVKAPAPAAAALPENAVLLGAFEATSLALPGEATREAGSLVLFSLADQEIVDVSTPVRFENSAR